MDANWLKSNFNSTNQMLSLYSVTVCFSRLSPPTPPPSVDHNVRSAADHTESSPSPDGENNKLEQLMISMLEERDRLMEKLRESQERYSETTRRLSEIEADNGILMRQLQALTA
ncbi:Liprin-alpha-1 [Geodia barretti]|uniref:Liprin-alpha-1 n=1 Tax=Geodia barretti TaxID=519541 RepID=A0AA35RKM4_GEOBA|nr:Liprin-alpha-1 [Geodia barretti]